MRASVPPCRRCANGVALVSSASSPLLDTDSRCALRDAKRLRRFGVRIDDEQVGRQIAARRRAVDDRLTIGHEARIGDRQAIERARLEARDAGARRRRTRRGRSSRERTRTRARGPRQRRPRSRRRPAIATAARAAAHASGTSPPAARVQPRAAALDRRRAGSASRASRARLRAFAARGLRARPAPRCRSTSPRSRTRHRRPTGSAAPGSFRDSGARSARTDPGWLRA